MLQALSTATTTNNPPPLMLPARRAAVALGLPEYTVREWIQKGLVKAVPCGRKRLVNVTLIRQQLESGVGEIWE